MKKGIACIALLAAVLMLSGCNLIGHDQALDDAQVVARVNGEEITKGQWAAERDYLIAYDQNYYQQYGLSLPVTDEALKSYGEEALQQGIQSVVLKQKMEELGLSPLTEEETAEVESYADSMVSMYKTLLRMQNYPDVETIEEEQARLAAEAEAAQDATPAEATEPAQPVATVTDAELDAMLTEDLNELGYTREIFVLQKTNNKLDEKLRDFINAGVTVTDEQIGAEFDRLVSEQQAIYDETPTVYASDVSAGEKIYYVPAGYRGVKNILVRLSSEDETAISDMNQTLSTTRTSLTNAQKQLDTLGETDTSDFDEEALAAHNDEVAALTDQVAQYTATIEETETTLAEATEAAFASILDEANEALAKAQAGEDFDALLLTYNDDPGMAEEPFVTTGYPVCEGLAIYEQAFQDAAMALANVGDVSDELVKTSYGYHILKYEMDIPSGAVEMTDEMKSDLSESLLTDAQDAAYQASVTQWVSEADVKTYPSKMK